MRRLLKLASPAIALAITVVSLQSLTAASEPETTPAPQPVVTESTLLPELASVSRVLAAETLERVTAESVPASVRAVLADTGAVLFVPTPEPGGLQ